MNTLHKLAISLAASAAAAMIAAPSFAGVIFDSQALGEPQCGSFTCITETRDGDLNYGAVVKFDANTSITQFGVFSSVNQEQDVKFLIFSSSLFGGPNNLLFSQTKHYGVTSQQFLYTDALSFTFLAGQTYDIGILSSGGTVTGRWIVHDIDDGGIHEISHNANMGTFADPHSDLGYAGVSPYIQLLNGDGAVPEPATWALMLGGFGGLGAMLRRRKAALA